MEEINLYVIGILKARQKAIDKAVEIYNNRFK